MLCRRGSETNVVYEGQMLCTEGLRDKCCVLRDKCCVGGTNVVYEGLRDKCCV
jgi:hypothetical protein